MKASTCLKNLSSPSFVRRVAMAFRLAVDKSAIFFCINLAFSGQLHSIAYEIWRRGLASSRRRASIAWRSWSRGGRVIP
jgi:hypothetical protein